MARATPRMSCWSRAMAWRYRSAFLGRTSSSARFNNTRFPTVGGLRRECMDYAGGSLHFYICGAANEYHGLQRHLAIQYAHLDFAIQEVREMQAVEGLFPELWGLRPMSEKTASYVVEESEEARHHRSADASLVADTPLPSSAGWAGPAGLRDRGDDALLAAARASRRTTWVCKLKAYHVGTLQGSLLVGPAATIQMQGLMHFGKDKGLTTTSGPRCRT